MPIIVESSSSDELVAPAPEPRVALPQAQVEEIRLKEVRDLSSESADFLFPSANLFFLILTLLQEQDTPNNSLFSFAVTLSDDEEVASRQVTLSSVPEDIRAKLGSIRTLLQEDIGRLVEDASPIR